MAPCRFRGRLPDPLRSLLMLNLYYSIGVLCSMRTLGALPSLPTNDTKPLVRSGSSRAIYRKIRRSGPKTLASRIGGLICSARSAFWQEDHSTGPWTAAEVAKKLVRGVRLCGACRTFLIRGFRINGRQITRAREFCDDACKMKAERRKNRGLSDARPTVRR